MYCAPSPSLVRPFAWERERRRERDREKQANGEGSQQKQYDREGERERQAEGEPTLCSCGTITTMGYRSAAIAGEMPNGLQDRVPA